MDVVFKTSGSSMPFSAGKFRLAIQAILAIILTAMFLTARIVWNSNDDRWSMNRTPLFIAAPLMPVEGLTEERQVRAVFSWLEMMEDQKELRVQISFATDDGEDITKLRSKLEKLGLSRRQTNLIQKLEGVEFIEFNDSERGTQRLPVVADIISRLTDQGEGIHMFINSDITLFREFPRVINSVYEAAMTNRISSEFFVTGKRRELIAQGSLSEQVANLSRLHEESVLHGARNRFDGVWAIDYFVFGQSVWTEIPRFVVGRPRFDNWLVANARGLRLDATNVIEALHVAHDYVHAGANESTIREDFSSPMIRNHNPGRDYNDRLAEESLEKGAKPFKDGRIDLICTRLALEPTLRESVCVYLDPRCAGRHGPASDELFVDLKCSNSSTGT